MNARVVKVWLVLEALALLAALAAFAWQKPAQAPDDQTALDIARRLQRQLGGRLMEKMQGEGPVGAIEYCSLEALPITDEVAAGTDWQLSRITDRPRNPANRASAAERELLDAMRADLAADGLKPLYRHGNAAYRPLVIQPLCLACHGESLAPAVDEALQARYPDDQARGYAPNELRGAIKIAPAQEEQ